MTINKSKIAAQICHKSGCSLSDSAMFVECLVRKIKSSLCDGKDVTIQGFGKFCVKAKKTRNGRNPNTGDPITIESRNIVTFRYSKKFKNALNGELQSE